MDPPAPKQAPEVDAYAEVGRGRSARAGELPAHGAERPSFRALFDSHISYVWSSLRRLGVAERDREDLANEVFFRVYQRLADYDPKRPIRPWLFAFAVRVASEHKRRASSRFEELGGGDDVASDAVAEPPKDAGDAALVTAALETLDMDKRAVLVLHDLDGSSVPEIAAALGIPEGTAYSRLRAAREHLTQALRRQRLREK
jgi:RNA polymerase sigma-70 factor (ECF subfamily)